jgi:putative DNA primase/helicase
MEPPAAAAFGVTRRRAKRKANGAHETSDRVNEDVIARLFVERYGRDLRYDHDARLWRRFNSRFWEPDRARAAFHMARLIAREVNAAGKATPARASTALGVERFAQADPVLATTSGNWDQNHWLLATSDGTVDLRTGKLRAADPADFITKHTAVGPAPLGTPTPIWDEFLREATGGDLSQIAFLKRLAGYCLSGDTSEHAVLFCYGGGGNGKSTFINTISGILGDYAMNASMETFTESKYDRHTTELARLCGARLVSAQETQRGRRWNESRIQALSGGEKVTARYMRQDDFEYQPTFKLLFSGNHQPDLSGVNDAMKRRLHMIPFTRKPAIVDFELPKKLRAEWTGILRWMIEGCLEWQTNGLRPSESVCAATSEYFEAQDRFSQWLDERCERGTDRSATQEVLYASWKAWAECNGSRAGGTAAFKTSLTEAGFEYTKHTPGQHDKRGFRGLALKPSAAPDLEAD